MKPREELVVTKETVVGYVEKNETQRIQVSVVDSNIGEFVAVTDMYTKDGNWCKGKGKWVPVDIADEVGRLMIAAYDSWEEN